MWDCFLTGSPKDAAGRRILKVLHGAEYLRYNLRDKRVDVWGDFFVENVSSEAACLRGLHRGNIEFELGNEGWVRDKYWTAVLREIAGEYIGLEIESGGEISLCRAGAEPLRVILLEESGPMKVWSPAGALGGAFACFTGWESPVIEPGRCCLFRVSGTIWGKTYERLMGEGEGNLIQIMGGEPLQKMIEDDMEREGDSAVEFKKQYFEFVKKYVENPKFYHVFFEFADGRKVKRVETSDDMKEKRLNLRFNGRYVTWCCSDMDFNIFAKANGPVLVVATEEMKLSRSV